MKSLMRFAWVGVLLALLAAVPPNTQATGLGDAYDQLIISGRPISMNMTSNTAGHIGILIKFVGTAQSGTVAVAAGGDITLKVGDSSSEAADTTTECPVSGALGGVIDVSDAACNTLGEVVDSINSSANWRAVIIDGLRSDSSDDTLTTRSETVATAVDGLPLYKDGAVDFLATACINCPRSMTQYVNKAGGQSWSFEPNLFKGTQAVVLYANETSTFGSGTSLLSVVSSLVGYKSGGTAGVGNAGTETATVIIGSLTGGATTVQAEPIKASATGPYGFLCRKDERCLVRLTNSAAMSAITMYTYGLNFRPAP